MCTRLSLLFAVVFSLMFGIAMPTRSLRAQDEMMGMHGMGMHGMGMDGMGMDGGMLMGMEMGSTAPPSPSNLPLKVTILLGPDYDFETKPFMTVQDVLKCFPNYDYGGGGMGGMGGGSVSAVQYRKPTSGLIDLDMKLSIPDKPERHVIARMPEGLKEEDVDSWKRKIRLKALRFGLNRVTFLPSDFSIPKDQSSMWLQVPVGSQTALKSNMEQHIAIALDLAESSETNGRRPRIDLFFSKELANQDPFAPTSQKYDPFAPATVDPFGGSPPKKTASPQRSDPFGAGTGADPFAAPPANKLASIPNVVEKTQRIRQQIAEELKSLREASDNEVPDVAESKVKDRIKAMFIELEREQIRMKQMHIQQLEKQLQQISESIAELSRPEAVEQRVQKQLESLENKLE
ncbi:MAG: septation ring formation regulator EzrA [bacterium]|nr:septation ring formation regulator EzrA [bacterium]